jgi:hypothetical protein
MSHISEDEVQSFLSHLSRVNDQLGKFIINLAVGWRGLYSSDADQQEQSAERSAESFKSDNPLLTQALENYTNSMLELAAIRNHAERVLREDEPLGAEIHKRHPINDEIRERLQVQRGFETEVSLSEFAAALGIEKEDAADLKAFLAFEEAEKRANLALDKIA